VNKKRLLDGAAETAVGPAVTSQAERRVFPRTIATYRYPRFHRAGPDRWGCVIGDGWLTSFASQGRNSNGDVVAVRDYPQAPRPDTVEHCKQIHSRAKNA